MITAEVRLRWLRGLSEVQTAQVHPGTGTPVDVPQPKILSFMVLFKNIQYIDSMSGTKLPLDEYQ
jgi:hypothetical protein